MLDPKRKRAPGGGRKAIAAEHTVRVTITLTPDDVAYLRTVDGNTSAAVRRVIAVAQKCPATGEGE